MKKSEKNRESSDAIFFRIASRGSCRLFARVAKKAANLAAIAAANLAANACRRDSGLPHADI
jgi:hypothetical protein